MYVRHCVYITKILTEVNHWESMSNRREPVTVAMMKYMLDIFLDKCREVCVGGNDADSKSKLVHEIRKQLSVIKKTVIKIWRHSR